MAAGPVGGAIAAWRCGWVFGLADHMVSVLIHLLPAVALFVHKWHRAADCQGELVRLGCRSEESFAPQSFTDVTPWLTLAPWVLYGVWQLTYFLIVQVRRALVWM